MQDVAAIQAPAAEGAADDSHPAGATVLVAGFWRRTGAMVIDLLCLVPPLLLLVWIGTKVTGFTAPEQLRLETVLELLLEGSSPVMGMIATGIIIALVYGFLFVGTTGATPGLRLLRLRVINVFGEAPEWWRVLLRGLGLLAGTALLGLGILWVGFDREKRGLHDWIAGTYVVRAGNSSR